MDSSEARDRDCEERMDVILKTGDEYVRRAQSPPSHVIATRIRLKIWKVAGRVSLKSWCKSDAQ